MVLTLVLLQPLVWQAAIKLECKEYGTVMLNFQTNFTEREAVREVILKMMARGKQVLAKQNASGNGKSGPKAQPTPALSPQEREWRGKLMGKRDVLRLRRRLVDTGAISDETFWNGMKYRYKPNCELRANGKEVEGENPIEAKDLGVPANVFSVRKGIPVNVSDWGKIPTPAQQHVAILEHPSVARARKALVKQIGEERFWEMFRWSSMAQHKTLSRAETSQMAEADNLFAPYLAREREMEQQERELRVKGLYKGLDLGHSDDHRSVHVLDGHTMGGEARPAKRSRGPDTTALRLLKTVNRHASLIVEEGNVANWRDEANSARPLEDLEDQEEPEYAKFDMEAKRQGSAPSKRKKVVMGSVVQAVWTELENWEPDLSRFARPITGTGKELETIIKKMQV